MFGIGIDITKISRFKNSKDTLIKKILHKEEIDEFNLSSNKEKYLASKWAIKEALFKADNNLLNFNQIRIKKDKQVYKYPGYLISTSSEDNYYIAIVKREG